MKTARFGPLDRPLLVVVGGGGVGKTTLAAALALQSAREGARTLVMTFDPSLRLKDALGVGGGDLPVRVPCEASGSLDAILLDARATFDRIVRRYAPDTAAAQRIFSNRFYQDLSGTLAGILEYMAMERLFEVNAEGRYDRIVLDTPPTRQALDFLEAPDRIISFLDTRAVKLAQDPWWLEDRKAPNLGKRFAARGARVVADRILGRQFLVELVEFIQAFSPLFEGFRSRAEEVRALLRSEDTQFLLVSGPGAERIPEAMFFLRKLKEAGHHLGPVVVNRVHPPAKGDGEGMAILKYFGDRDQRGLQEFRDRFPRRRARAGTAPAAAPALRPGGTRSARSDVAGPAEERLKKDSPPRSPRHQELPCECPALVSWW
jgi:anion-transporting  ArsA/GET3 family ATPase